MSHKLFEVDSTTRYLMHTGICPCLEFVDDWAWGKEIFGGFGKNDVTFFYLFVHMRFSLWFE